MSSDPLSIPGGYNGQGLVACGSFFIIFCTFLVSLRIYAKHYLSRARWGWDDYLLIPTLLISLAFFSLFIYTGINLGGGYHIIDVESVNPALLISYGKALVVLAVLYTFCLQLNRCCILAAYLRFFSSRSLRFLTWTLLAISTVNAIATLIVTFLACIPLEGAWNPSVRAVCINQRQWWALGTIPVVIFDICTMALPVSTILQLKRPLNERMALLASFLAYGFATIAEIIRILIFSSDAMEADHTWTLPEDGYASICAVSAYITACCIPGLRSLWIHRKSRLSSQATAIDTSAQTLNKMEFNSTHQQSMWKSVVPVVGPPAIDSRRSDSSASEDTQVFNMADMT